MQSTMRKGRRLRAGDKTAIHGLQVEEGSGNVFADLGLPDAEERLAKSRLAALISESIKKKGWTQAEAAERLDTHQPTISALQRGRLRSITYDRLVHWVLALGHSIEIRVGQEMRREAHLEVAIAGR